MDDVTLCEQTTPCCDGISFFFNTLCESGKSFECWHDIIKFLHFVSWTRVFHRKYVRTCERTILEWNGKLQFSSIIHRSLYEVVRKVMRCFFYYFDASLNETPVMVAFCPIGESLLMRIVHHRFAMERNRGESMTNWGVVLVKRNRWSEKVRATICYLCCYLYLCVSLLAFDHDLFTRCMIMSYPLGMVRICCDSTANVFK